MKRWILVLLFFWGLFASCSNNPQKNAAPSATTGATAPSNITASVDWRARTVSITGYDAYDIDFCEGAGPLLCVSKGGDVLGVVELITRRNETFNAAQFLDDTEADRHNGCPGYAMTRDTPTKNRYGFTGRLQDKVVERVVGIVLPGPGLHILVMNALADSGCLNRESELPLDVAASIETVLPALADGSKNLPVT